jgi:hypothetical protein
VTFSGPIANLEWKPSSSRPAFGVLVAVGELTAALARADCRRMKLRTIRGALQFGMQF